MPYINVGKENSGDIILYYKDWGKGSATRSRRSGLHPLEIVAKAFVLTDYSR